MASLIKAKVINKVKGQFGQQINQTDPNGLLKQSADCNIMQVSKLFFTVAKLKGQSVKGQYHIGSNDSLLCYL